MTGLEYMRTVCPTTSRGKDPLREDVMDAFEDGIAEGIIQCKAKHWKPTREQIDALKKASRNEYLKVEQYDTLVILYEQLKAL